MSEDNISNILKFTKQCDNDFFEGLYMCEKSKIAKNYLEELEKIPKGNRTNLINALIDKLKYIKNIIDAENYYSFKTESILNLVSLSVTDYIINIIKESHLTDPLLITRFAYIELAKVLYYDISYVKQQDLAAKQTICNAHVNVEKEKIFSYVVCSQWLEIITYILKQFGITVKKQNIPGQDHVWGEVELNEKYIVIMDATDYIDSSIDLGNAKAKTPTVGFVTLPKEYSGIKLYDVFNNPKYKDIATRIKLYYEGNRELDMSLGYIRKKGYKIESIIAENEIFNYPDKTINNKEDLKRLTTLTMDFFRTLKIPTNMDGYEIFSYYSNFIRELPKNIAANISQQTIYVDSFSYKQKKMRKKFLHVSEEYLSYLDGLVYNTYYKYLSGEENNSILEEIKHGNFNGEQISEMIAEYELRIAEINRKLNLYYAINKLQFYDPLTYDTLGIQLYEPMMGTKILKTQEEYEKFKSSSIL